MRVKAFSLALLALSMSASHVHAAAVLGFREDFPTANGTAGWAGGALVDNPGAGGAPGSADGWLRVTRDIVQQLGTNSTGAEYTGNWTAGITQVRLWLTDPGTNEDLEIHFGLGVAFTNFWQYNVGFIPPDHAWAPFVVDLGSAAWTRIVGASGTFADAKASVERILLRHDKAPYGQSPDPIMGDFGVDRILLTNGIVGVDDAPVVTTLPVQLAAPYPNPSAGPVALAFQLAESGPVRLEVVDVSGRRVRSAERSFAAGPNTWMWDGRDDHGARVAPGSYRVRAIGAGGGTSRPLVRIAR